MMEDILYALYLATAYLYSPVCIHNAPGVSHGSYNMPQQTVDCSQDHRDTYRVGSGLQSPGQGHHKTLANICINRQD